MTIQSIISYRALQDNVRLALESYIDKYINNSKNGTIKIYHKVRLILLKRYADYILNRQLIYTEYTEDFLYKENEIVISDSVLYICFKDLDAIGVLITDKEYWSVYPTFTYDYDKYITVLNNINHICHSNLTI